MIGELSDEEREQLTDILRLYEEKYGVIVKDEPE